MKTQDLLENWIEPTEITEWGDMFDKSLNCPVWEAYIGMMIHPDMMSVLYRIIFPVFVEIQGCVLLQIKTEGHSKENLLRFIEQDTSPCSFERSFNVLKVYDLFDHIDVKTDASFEIAAGLLKKSWEISLKLAFPDKSFKVELSNTDRDYGPTLSLFSVEDDCKKV